MKKIIILLLVLAPFLASAQLLHDVNDVAKKATNIGNLAIELLISLAVVWIIFSVIRYFVMNEGEEAHKAGGMAILYGIIGLFVILSIWGMVFLLKNSFRFSDTNRPDADFRKIMIPDPTTNK
jgi:hydrogenase-4 membrane subunit HyfE